MQEHISTSFDEDLNELDRMVVTLSGLAQSQLRGVASVISAIDKDFINSLIANDKNLDALEAEIFEKTVEIIALRSPHAKDLRKVLVSPKIASSLERIGDHARNVGKRLNLIAETATSVPYADELVTISNIALSMVVDVSDAYARSDDVKAKEIWNSDLKLDTVYNDCIAKVLKAMDQGESDITVGTHCLFIAKNFERIGDHATGIAEQIYFRINAEMLDDDRPKMGDAEA